MTTTVAQMTREELEELITKIVSTTIDKKIAELQRELEDDGEIRPEVRNQLLKQLKSVESGERGVPFAQVIQQLGLT